MPLNRTRRRLLITVLVAAGVISLRHWIMTSDPRYVGTWVAEKDPYGPTPIHLGQHWDAEERDKFSNRLMKYHWSVKGNQIRLEHIPPHRTGFARIAQDIGRVHRQITGRSLNVPYFWSNPVQYKWLEIGETEAGEAQLSIRDERIGHTYRYRRKTEPQ